MNNNPLAMIIQAVRNGGNPMAMFRQMAGQNPQVAQFMNMINGKNSQQMRSMAENVARERGIDINDLAHRLGIR